MDGDEFLKRGKIDSLEERETNTKNWEKMENNKNESGSSKLSEKKRNKKTKCKYKKKKLNSRNSEWNNAGIRNKKANLQIKSKIIKL
jgi:hypothetical protein